MQLQKITLNSKLRLRIRVLLLSSALLAVGIVLLSTFFLGRGDTVRMQMRTDTDVEHVGLLYRLRHGERELYLTTDAPIVSGAEQIAKGSFWSPRKCEQMQHVFMKDVMYFLETRKEENAFAYYVHMFSPHEGAIYSAPLSGAEVISRFFAGAHGPRLLLKKNQDVYVVEINPVTHTLTFSHSIPEWFSSIDGEKEHVLQLTVFDQVYCNPGVRLCSVVERGVVTKRALTDILAAQKVFNQYAPFTVIRDIGDAYTLEVKTKEGDSILRLVQDDAVYSYVLSTGSL